MNLSKIFLVWLCIIYAAKITFAQTIGCTDYRANNFNNKATFNDGSCTYNATSYAPLTLIYKLSDTLNETSGILTIGGELWSFGDSGNPNTMYHFDKVNGAILQTIVIKNVVNHDWEDITADANNIYIGDFGNNDGNRLNLAVYKISKSQLTTKIIDTITAQKIFFNYTDQKSFATRAHSNRYDCEAMFVWNDTIHLFSKDWIDGHSKHYLLPTVPGTYSIAPIDSFNPGCLITGAAIEPISKRIVLVGYNKTGYCYLWLLWDFNSGNIFSGNKRKIDIGFFVNTGQTEGVCFKDSSNIYITNELVTNFVNNKLYAADVGQWMNPKTPGVGVDFNKQDISGLELFPNPATNEIMANYFLKKPATVSYCIYSIDGKLVYCSKVKMSGGYAEQKLNISSLSKGTYTFVVHSEKTISERKIFIKQ